MSEKEIKEIEEIVENEISSTTVEVDTKESYELYDSQNEKRWF